MERVRQNSSGKCHEVYFVNEHDHAIFPAHFFGLAKKNYENLNDRKLIANYIAVEFFLNWYQYEYTVVSETDYLKGQIVGYSAKGRIKCRLLVTQSKNKIACGIRDGGELFNYFSPYSMGNADTILNNSEAFPISVRARIKTKIKDDWEKEKNGWIMIAKWIFEVSNLYDIPRQELIDYLAKDLSERTTEEFLDKLMQFQKKHDIQKIIEFDLLPKKWSMS